MLTHQAVAKRALDRRDCALGVKVVYFRKSVPIAIR